MKVEDLKNKKIAILGFSLEGVSTAKFLSRHNIAFSIIEKNEREVLIPEAQEFLNSFKGEFIFGKNHLQSLSRFDLISRSQGIPLWLPELLEAKKGGCEITSMTKLFFDFCRGTIIGVTGTKGKGTTSTLIYEMLVASGKRAFLGGNIGRSPLDFVDELGPSDFAVLELSSFQLEDLEKSPKIAVILMTTADHLNSQAQDSPNYHQSLGSYLEAKKNIVRFQNEEDVAIINYDYEQSRSFADCTKAQKFFFSVTPSIKDGAFLENNELVLSIGGNRKLICMRQEVFLRGEHNLQNSLAASLAALASGADFSKIVEVVKTFKGLEHRLEFVREISGVTYFNDSFSTTPETAIAATKAFTEPEILILGGSEKGSDYGELGRIIATSKNMKSVILIGNTAGQIKNEIVKNNPPKNLVIISDLNTMSQVVKKSRDLSCAGDVVLLTPACASFDMFKSYKDRGQQFKDEVNRL